MSETNNSEGSISGIDWQTTLKTLEARARGQARFMPAVFNLGISVEDIVADVVVLFLDSPDMLGWDPSKSSLNTFLWSIVRHRILDNIRKARRFSKSIDDPQSVDSIETALVERPVNVAVDYEEAQTRLMACAKGDRQIEALIKAVAEITNGGKVNKQLEGLMGIPAKMIAIIKRKLLRRLRRKEGVEWRTITTSSSTKKSSMK